MFIYVSYKFVTSNVLKCLGFFSLVGTVGRKYSMSLVKKTTEVMGVCVQRGKEIEDKTGEPK